MIINDTTLYELSVQLGTFLKQNNKLITCAESCTGGWMAKILTDVAGSTNWFECSFVTYSDQSKINLLNVHPWTIKKFTAVSDIVVKQMAFCALQKASADYAVAISGIAGPEGGTIDKPAGTVWFGFAETHNHVFSQHMYFNGDRESVRRQAIYFAMTTLLSRFF